MTPQTPQPMRRSLNGIIAMQAFIHTKDARPWHLEKNFHYEVQECITAQLFMGLLVEGVANELGEELLLPWVWERLQKNGDAAFKWWTLSYAERQQSV